MIKWNRKNLISLEDLSAADITLILDTAKSFLEIATRQVKKVPTLRGKTVVNLFFENSTRTRTSFELAAKRLSADILNFSVSTSSLQKGESMKDTARNIEAMKVDIVIIRHAMAGTPLMLSKIIEPAVINAGDGAHAHPTQALLDLFTIREKLGRIKNLNVSIIGDIEHSRVARSNIIGLKKLGANVTVCGPRTLLPIGIEELGVKVTTDVEQAIKDADVLNILRVQRERQNDKLLFPSLREYNKYFGITTERLKKAKKDVLIMHPGPINRGVEIATEVADGKYSVILEQVTNGVAVRMAVLYLVSGGENEDTD